jgi:hypothetical protein
VLGVAPNPKCGFCQSDQVGIVIDNARGAKSVFERFTQRVTFPARRTRGEQDDAMPHIHRSAETGADPNQVCSGDTVRCHQLIPQIDGAPDQFLWRFVRRFAMHRVKGVPAEIHQCCPQSVAADIETKDASLTAEQSPAVVCQSLLDERRRIEHGNLPAIAQQCERVRFGNAIIAQ